MQLRSLSNVLIDANHGLADEKKYLVKELSIF